MSDLYQGEEKFSGEENVITRRNGFVILHPDADIPSQELNQEMNTKLDDYMDRHQFEYMWSQLLEDRGLINCGSGPTHFTDEQFSELRDILNQYRIVFMARSPGLKA